MPLIRREFELLMESKRYKPGTIHVFQVYGHSQESLDGILGTSDSAIKSLCGVEIVEAGRDIYRANWEDEEPTDDNYIRTVKADNPEVEFPITQILAARSYLLIELILKKENISYDHVEVQMPLNKAFGEAAAPISLEGLALKAVRYYPAN